MKDYLTDTEVKDFKDCTFKLIDLFTLYLFKADEIGSIKEILEIDEAVAQVSKVEEKIRKVAKAIYAIAETVTLKENKMFINGKEVNDLRDVVAPLTNSLTMISALMGESNIKLTVDGKSPDLDVIRETVEKIIILVSKHV